MKRKRAKRLLSFLLAILLMVGDGAILEVMAASVSGGDGVEITIPKEEATDVEEAEPWNEVGTMDSADAVYNSGPEFEVESTVSQGNIPLRQPEGFYEEPAEENYGSLVGYDEYSRTYHVEADRYVTVIGNDANTYVDEEGELNPVDNTLMVNPMSTFARMNATTSYINTANDYQAQLKGDVTVSGGDLYTLLKGEHMISVSPTEGSFLGGVVKDNAIRYNNVFENIDYQYTILGNSVKEDIILLEPVEKNSFSFLLNTYGLETELIRNTLYVYEEGKNPEKEAVFVLEAPIVNDGVKM